MHEKYGTVNFFWSVIENRFGGRVVIRGVFIYLCSLLPNFVSFTHLLGNLAECLLQIWFPKIGGSGKIGFWVFCFTLLLL